KIRNTLQMNRKLFFVRDQSRTLFDNSSHCVTVKLPKLLSFDDAGNQTAVSLESFRSAIYHSIEIGHDLEQFREFWVKLAQKIVEDRGSQKDHFNRKRDWFRF